MGVFPRAAWCVLLCACSKPAPAARTLELEGVRAQVPAAWPPSPAAQTQRLEAAGRRRDPAAEVHVVAVGPDNSRAPALSLVVIHHSRGYTQDSNARDMARDSVTEAKQAAAARGITTDSSYSCATHHCTLKMSLEFREGSMHVRTQFWRLDGHLVSAGCAGTDAGAVAACELPPAPPNADPIPPD
jgi:hypothetical protein